MEKITRKIFRLFVLLIVLLSQYLFSQNPITIQVDVSQSLGILNPFWNGVGQDSFNEGILAPHNQSTYDLIKDMNDRLQKSCIKYIRTCGIYADSLTAWGEDIGGHVYEETVGGEPSYHWTITDNVIDNILSKGFKPIITLTYMPDDLASDPDNRNDWNYANVSPPKDYNKWRNLVYETVKHFTERYGSVEVENWFFEVWNEPDIPTLFWISHPDIVNYPNRGDNEEYFKLYDYAADGALQANPNIKIGGPAIAGDIDLFINRWLDHVIDGVNYATGGIGTRVDFISRHGYGKIDSKIIEGIRLTIESIYWRKRDFYEKMVSNEIQFIYTETGPYVNPAEWLNTQYVPAWVMKEVDAVIHIGDVRGIAYMPDVMCFWTLPTPANFGTHFGVATALGNEWNLSADGVVKRPAFNVFEMLGLLGNERIDMTGTVYGDPVHGIATKKENNSVAVILYHLNEDDYNNENSEIMTVNLTIHNIPFVDGQLKVYKIDETHSNAYTVWKNLGSPNAPTAEELNQLKSRDDLELAEPETNIKILNSTYTQNIQMQSNSVMLLVLEKETIPPDPPTGVQVIQPFK